MERSPASHARTLSLYRAGLSGCSTHTPIFLRISSSQHRQGGSVHTGSREGEVTGGLGLREKSSVLLLKTDEECRGIVGGRMLPVLLLMSLLMGSVEVNAAPFDKGSRQEEMMTRCIIEVLSNALAKPNAPPIDQECKEILRKSNRHNPDEEEGELKQYETRTIKDPVGLDNHQHDSKEEAKQSPDLPKEEYEEKRHHAESESREEKEEEKLKETEQFDEKEESTGHSKERDFAEGEDDDEERDHKKHYEKEDMEKRNKYHEDSQESAHDILDKRAHHTDKHTKELPEEENEDDVKNLEEILKRHALSKNEKEQLLQPEKFHSIHSSKVPEENDGWEEEKEKISYKPNHEELIKRLFGYEEKQGHHEEPRNNFADPRGQKPHFGETSLENHLIKNYFDKRSHYDKESLEEAREKKHHHQDSEEEGDHHDSSEESNEKELTDHHHEEKRRQEERKRWPSQQNSRLNYEESNEDSEESEEGIDKRHEHEQEKENFYRKLKNHLQGSEEAEPFRQEKKQDEKRYYIGEEMVDGMKRYYPKLPQEDLRQYEESKNRHIREDREESNLPDIDTYTCLWGKKKFLEDLRRRYGGNRSAAKMPKLEEKREYDRMDELAQLLNYKKRSFEYPDSYYGYDSEEMNYRNYDEGFSEEADKLWRALMDLKAKRYKEQNNARQG